MLRSVRLPSVIGEALPAAVAGSCPVADLPSLSAAVSTVWLAGPVVGDGRVDCGGSAIRKIWSYMSMLADAGIMSVFAR